MLTHGAKGDGNTDDTAAIQAAISDGNKTGAAVFFPAAVYRVSQLVLMKGTIQGVVGHLPRQQHDLRVLRARPARELQQGPRPRPRTGQQGLHPHRPDGANYCCIDLVIDGNKNNNVAGHGLCIADGAAGQEGQFIVDRCYFHDNPDSNVYLGHNRRANNVHNSVLNYSKNGDGITVAGSDNTIASNILGSNGRAGLCLGTGATQNWPASSPSTAAAIAHVQNNDIYGNLVGIALANAASGAA